MRKVFNALAGTLAVAAVTLACSIPCGADVPFAVPYTHPDRLSPGVKYRLVFRLYDAPDLHNGSFWDETIDETPDQDGVLRACLGGLGAKPFPSAPAVGYLNVTAPTGYPTLPPLHDLNESAVFAIPRDDTVSRLQPAAVPAADAPAAWNLYYTDTPFCQMRLAHFVGTPIFANRRLAQGVLGFFDVNRFSVGAVYVPENGVVLPALMLRLRASYRAHILFSKGDDGTTFDLTDAAGAEATREVSRAVETQTGSGRIGIGVGFGYRAKGSAIAPIGVLSIPLSPWAAVNLGVAGIGGKPATTYGISVIL